MALPERDVEVTFKAPDERKGERHVMPGTPDYAINMVQNEEGVYSKRDGYSKLARTADVGAIVSGKALMKVGEKIGLATSDTLYTYDTTLLQWTWRDNRRTAFPSYETGLANHGFCPSMIKDSFGQHWYFAGCTEISAITGTITRHPTYRVVTAQGVEVRSASEFDTTFVAQTMMPVELSGKIYLFYYANGVIKLAVWNTSSPASAPTITTYYTPPAGSINSFDVTRLSSSIVVVCWGTGLNGGTEGIYTSLLDTATGLTAASPTPVYTSGGAAGPGCLFKNVGTGSAAGTMGRNGDLEYFSLTTGLVMTISTLDASPPADPCYRLSGGLSGTNSVIFASFTADVTVAPQDSYVKRYTRTSGGSITSGDFARQAWLASDPVVINSRMYVLLSHEDIAQSTTTNPFQADQRAYTLYDENLDVPIARALYEEGGGDVYNRANFTQTPSGGASPAYADGNSFVCSVNACRDGLGDYYSVKLSFDTAPDLGPAIPVDDVALLPGGYPMVLGSWGTLDAAPQFYPDEIELTAVAGGPGTYTGTFGVVVTYVFIAPDGRELESQPSTFRSKTCAAEFIRVSAPTLRQLGGLSSMRVFVRAYATTDAGTTLYQQRQVPNNATTDRVSIDLRGLGVGKTLYTEGGVIENAPPPPFKFGCVWQDRVFVSGTPVRGEVWGSKKSARGKFTQWMDDGKFQLHSRVRALCPVNQSYLAIFTDERIAVIGGDGPTNIGGDPYKPAYLADEQTCTNPNSTTDCPLGCIFQGRDGGIYLLGLDLTVKFIGRGIDNYKSLTITSATHLPKAQRVVLTTGTYQFVWDYGRKPGSPANEADFMGQWYIYSTLENWPAVAAMDYNDAHYFLDSSGFVWYQVASQAFDGTSSFIGQSFRLPLNFSGIAGFNRVLRGVFIGDWIGAHTISLTNEVDGTTTVLADKPMTSSAMTTWDWRPAKSKCAKFGIVVTEKQYLSNLNKGFSIDGFGFEVQRIPGLKRATTRLG